MIDIHTHLLPKIDDGPSTWEESIEMLKEGQEDGVREIILTPHILKNLDDHLEKEIRKRFVGLRKRAAAAGISIKLHLGSEIYLQPDTNLDRGLSTLNENGKYFLVEFPMSSIPEYASLKLFEFVMDGFVPILAHPERNAIILRRPSQAYQFVQMGILIQINSGSLLGDFGQAVRATAFDLIEHNLVHLVASDCHDANSRPLA
ncbi:MAG: tyrosine-protein phosphatase, partial [bacterium]